MTPPLRLALVVHNHQPIGNFDAVVDEAYHDSYLPLLEALVRHPGLRLTMHLSGSLYDWLEERHPEYLDGLAALARRGRVQILGGAYYEPILPMIPQRDRLAQIRLYGEKLAKRFGAAPRGMWLAERVWEQQLANDLAEAGIDHTVVDEFHFQNAGLKPEQLHGYYLTEDAGRVVAMFPGNERLRYLLPFAPPEDAIAYMRSVAEAQPGATLVFADDGEKFGSWPGMREHCHADRWLDRFFTLLESQSWIETTTLAETCQHVEPLGKIYLPDSSYREMNEWASLDGTAAPGQWRTFLVKYPESGEMHARMLMVSDRIERAAAVGYPDDVLAAARRELHRGQCNCAYWHGTFGGVYYSHLRQAIYRHLIRADEILDRTADRPDEWCEVSARDHNLDGRPEVCLSGDKLMAFFSPAAGGSLYELDQRPAARNALAVVARRDERFHHEAGRAAVHDAARRVLHDCRPDECVRRSFVEHFYSDPPTLDDAAAGRTHDLGDFAGGRFQFQVRQTPQAAQLRMTREGRVGSASVKLTKTFTLAAGSQELICEYLLENLPPDWSCHFAVEFNFAGFGGGDRRYMQLPGGRRLGDFTAPLAFPNVQNCELVDGDLGLRVGFDASRAAAHWTYPVEAVHRCQLGLEASRQATCFTPHWLVRGDVQGKWNVTIRLPVEAIAVTAPLRDTDGRPLHGDLGDASPQLEYPAARTVTETEVIRGKQEVRQTKTRRLKRAG